MNIILKIKRETMSNNVTAASGGSILGMISLAVQNIPVQSAAEVFIFGVIGGVAGILGKILAQWIIKKIKKLCNIKSKNEKQQDE